MRRNLLRTRSWGVFVISDAYFLSPSAWKRRLAIARVVGTVWSTYLEKGARTICCGLDKEKNEQVGSIRQTPAEFPDSKTRVQSVSKVNSGLGQKTLKATLVFFVCLFTYIHICSAWTAHRGFYWECNGPRWTLLNVVPSKSKIGRHVRKLVSMNRELVTPP